MFPSLSILALMIFLTPLLLLLMLTNPISRKNAMSPPSPRKLPLIGNAHQLSSLLHRSLHSLSQIHGPLMFLQLGSVQTIVISSADMAREVMKTHDNVFASRPRIKAALALYKKGMDVVFANGEHWRKTKKLCVNHLLSFKMVQSYQHVREEEVISLLSKVSDAASSLDGAVDMTGLLCSYTCSILCTTVLGDLSKGASGLNHEILYELLVEESQLLAKFFIGDHFPYMGWLDEVLGFGGRTRRLAKRWDGFLDEIITNIGKLESNTNLGFLGALLALKKDDNLEINLTTDIIKVLVHEMIFGGIDTSLASLEWGLAELVRNKEVMEKLKEEVREAGQGKEKIREEDLSQMLYLKAVVKEIFRLHPPAPLLPPREATQNCLLQGYEVRVGAKVFVNVWSIGRDPDIWEQPEEFRPERFLGNPTDFRGHNFDLIPFGAGRRICPGMQFAVQNIDLVLANLVYRFDWQLPEGMKIEGMDMEEIPGLIVRKKKRLHLVAKEVLG